MCLQNKYNMSIGLKPIDIYFYKLEHPYKLSLKGGLYMNIGEFIDIPVLIIVYLLMEVVKKFILKKNDERRDAIPLIALLAGSFIALLIYYVWPEMSPNTNPLTAFASGAVSGSASTGSNRIYKYIMRFFDPAHNYNPNEEEV